MLRTFIFDPDNLKASRSLPGINVDPYRQSTELTQPLISQLLTYIANQQN
ncbi:hypothetical protein Hanom_Chr12g01093621 [Helianthus anomalus]